MERAHRRATARARSLAYGRRRAARRVQTGRFTPHPGWRHRVPDGVVVLRDQATALARVDDLIDAELWRSDRRDTALAVLRGLVCGMDWDSGLVAGVTRATLAAAAACSPRTVSRVLAWAQEVGLLVCVETGASAEFLGTEINRAPSYVLTAPVAASPQSSSTTPVEELVNPPACGGWRSSPRPDQGLQDRLEEGERESSGRQDRVTLPPWPVFDRATTAAERARAVATLLERAGLVGRVISWRAVAMLGPWFAAGWCVVGLLHALDHHPDHPQTSRGDAARAARDPLRVLGHRLAPWRGRLTDLPAGLAAVDGHARRTRAATLTNTANTETRPAARADTTAPAATAGVAAGRRPAPASPAARAAARAQITRVLTRPRQQLPSGSKR